MIKYKSTQTSLELIGRFIRAKIFDLISDKRLSLFIRSNDIISASPILEGTHEPQVVDFFSCASKNGYSDFLVDIGGNIGLTSCLASKYFSSVFVYEINPLAFKILEVNVGSLKDSEKFTLNNFGIGAVDGKTTLVVPKHNWGGAYVADNGNSYSDQVLANKDGFSDVKVENYDRAEVLIRKGSGEFTRIFDQSLTKHGRAVKGVVKIDVEGYERTIIKELAKSTRDGVSLLVIFENWDPDLTANDILSDFSGKSVSLSKIFRQTPFPPKASKLTKFMLFALLVPLGLAKYQYTLKSLDPDDLETSLLGDLVLELIGE
mgnify:CR=1 FL=1